MYLVLLTHSIAVASLQATQSYHIMLLFAYSGRPVRTFQEHGSWIVNVHFTGGMGGHEMLSGCAAGDVRFWDIRSEHIHIEQIYMQSRELIWAVRTLGDGLCQYDWYFYYF